MKANKTSIWELPHLRMYKKETFKLKVCIWEKWKADNSMEREFIFIIHKENKLGGLMRENLWMEKEKEKAYKKRLKE